MEVLPDFRFGKAVRIEQMEKMYVIAWKSKQGEGAGTGKRLFSRDEAERLVEELNRDYPDFEHTVAPADSSEPAPALEVPAAAG